MVSGSFASPLQDLSLKHEEAAAAAAQGVVAPVVVYHEPGLIRMWHK